MKKEANVKAKGQVGINPKNLFKHCETCPKMNEHTRLKKPVGASIYDACIQARKYGCTRGHDFAFRITREVE